MIYNRIAGGATYSGAHVVSLALQNPQQLANGTLVALQEDTLIACDSSQLALGVLMHSASDHVTVGIAGIFNALGQGAAGSFADAGRAYILASFSGLDSHGNPSDIIQVIL